MPSVEEMNTEIPDTIISGQWEEIFNTFDVCSSRHILGLLFQSVGTGRGSCNFLAGVVHLSAGALNYQCNTAESSLSLSGVRCLFRLSS